jgi:tetratricopeptide (TPR) repeat protein
LDTITNLTTKLHNLVVSTNNKLVFFAKTAALSREFDYSKLFGYFCAMKHLFFLFFMCALCCNAAMAQSRGPEMKLTPKEAKESADTFNFEERPYFLLIEQSEKALENNDYDTAGLRLIEAMSVEPQNPLNIALMTNLGMIYYYNEQDSLALVTLDEAVRRSPRLVGAHEMRARVLTGMGRDRDAYDDYTAIIEIDSVNTNARFMRGMMALYHGKLDVAEGDFEVLNRVVPLSRNTMLAYGTLYAMTGRDHEAISYFRKLLEVEKMPEYYASLAGCFIAVDNLDDASKTLGEAFERYPNDPELYYYRAKLNKLRYMADDAQRDAKRAIELGADPRKVAAIFQ